MPAGPRNPVWLPSHPPLSPSPPTHQDAGNHLHHPPWRLPSTLPRFPSVAYSAQFRSNWVVDNAGNYSATITSPTGIPSDPPLAAHGVVQARELAAHAVKLDPKVERIYSSPFYRCLETINPLAEALDLPILPENGIGCVPTA